MPQDHLGHPGETNRWSADSYPQTLPDSCNNMLDADPPNPKAIIHPPFRV